MIRDQQNALISVDKLLKLAEMKQKGIHRFKCHYSVIYENVIDPSVNFEEKRKFAFDSNKLFLEKDTQMTDQPIYTRAYDGENCYSLLAYPSGHKHAGVLSAEDGQLQIFFSLLPL